ncbi:hypothetical protein J6V85_03365 [Candidatus Saccharibacteria bacterium]|nr:hypothetical protein [Candidatus Saccharibacteria bacterium]
MKYIVIDERKNGYGDMFSEEFDSLRKSINYANNQWYYWTEKEKNERRLLIIESVNPDEEAENYFDGRIIFNSDYKEKGE